MSPSRAVGQRDTGLHVALLIVAILTLVPFLWVVAAGFRTQISLLIGELWFEPSLDNFREVLFSKTSEFLLNYRNSLIIGVASTVLCLVIGTLAAWSLHRMRWPRWVPHLFLVPNEPEGFLSLETDGSRLDYLPVIEDAGFRLKVEEPAFRDPAVQALLEVRDRHCLFERAG